MSWELSLKTVGLVSSLWTTLLKRTLEPEPLEHRSNSLEREAVEGLDDWLTWLEQK